MQPTVMQQPMQMQPQGQAPAGDPTAQQDTQQIRQQFEQMRPEEQMMSIKQLLDGFVDQVEGALGPTAVYTLADVIKQSFMDEQQAAPGAVQQTPTGPMGSARPTLVPPRSSAGRQLPDKSIF